MKTGRRHSGEDIWIALDFETATSARDSACSLGFAVIEDDAVIETGGWLIRPPDNLYYERNIGIHGITPEDTENAPTFEQLFPEVLPYLEGRNIIAHSASFDVSVLRSLISLYGLPTPDTRYVCSCNLARRAFPRLENHKLPTVCRHCGISLDHHEAVSDAYAAAMVALHCGRSVGAATLSDAVGRLGVGVGVL